MKLIQVSKSDFVKRSDILRVMDGVYDVQLLLKNSEWVQVDPLYSELVRFELEIDEIRAKSQEALSYLKAVDNFRQWKLENAMVTQIQIKREMIRCLPKKENAPNSLMYRSVVVVAPYIDPEVPTAELHRWVIKMTDMGYSLVKETFAGEKWQWDNGSLVISIEFQDCGRLGG